MGYANAIMARAAREEKMRDCKKNACVVSIASEEICFKICLRKNKFAYDKSACEWTKILA